MLLFNRINNKFSESNSNKNKNGSSYNLNCNFTLDAHIL